jgi:uncharacterized membrane protein
MKQNKEEIDLRDIIQIIVGSLGGALAIAPTEEFHLISQSIPWPKLIILFFVTLIFIGLIAYRMGIRAISRRNILAVWILPIRIILIYCISCLSCLFALWIYDLIPVGTPLFIIINKLVVLALPATAGGTLIDLIGTKHR